MPFDPSPPVLPPANQVDDAAAVRQPYRPLDGKAKTIEVLGWLVIGFTALAAIGNVYFGSVLSGAVEGVEPDGYDVARQGFLAPMGIAISLFFAMFVVFILWFRSAYRNLDALGDKGGMRFGWAVWAWIVPIVSLFLGRMMAGEIVSRGRTHNPQAKATPTLLNWWWLLWIGTLLLANSIGGSFDVTYAEQADLLGVLRFVLVALAAMVWVKMLVVNRITTDLDGWREQQRLGVAAGGDSVSA